MFLMRKYEMLGFFIIALISIAFALLFWILPSNFITNGLGPTNDSLWQIGKLMFISILIYAIIEYFIFGNYYENFAFAKAATLFLAPILYISLSYFLDMGMGNASLNNHLVAYAISLFVGQYASYYLLNSDYYFKFMNVYAILGMILMMALYIGYGNQTDRFEAPIFKSMKSYQSIIRNIQ